MFKEFKEFIARGNIMELAIGVVIGGAFQKIVTSLVEDVMMPFVSMFTGKVDFSDMVIQIGSATIKYGNFITAIVNFLIIAFSIFLVVKYLNKLNKLKEIGEDLASKIDPEGKLKINSDDEEEEPETKICPYCLTEIKYKATRCPNCTSELENKAEIEEE